MNEGLISVQAIQASLAAQGPGAVKAMQAQLLQETQAVPDPQAVEAFQNAMNTPEVENIPFVSQLAETWATVQENHQGILYRIKALNETQAGRSLSMKELTELQYNVSNLTFVQEVTASVAKKASDGIQSLIKNN